LLKYFSVAGRSLCVWIQCLDLWEL